MHMITKKKIIAALLIPIMLIAFSAPSFAASTTSGIDLSGFAQKALNLALKVGTTSLEIVKDFAGEFMGVSDIDGAIDLSGNLITTGISSVTELVKIFTTASYTPEGILPLLWDILGFAVDTGLTFANIIFPEYGFSLTNPSGFLNFATDLFGFAINAGQTLVGAVTGELDLGDLGDLVSGSNMDLSGIFDMLLPSDGQQPAIDPTTILGNVNTSNVIGLISSVMTSGPAQDIINSGTEILGGIFNSLITPDSNTNQPVLDFIEIPDVEDENEEIPNTDNSNKPDIADQPNSETSYKVVPNLEAVLGKIKDENLYGNNYHSKNLAYCYAKLLAGKEISEQDLNQGASANTVIPTETVGIPALKAYINNNKPTIVNVDNSTLVCVGYANQGTKLSDFLFINPTTGEKTTLSDNTQLPDGWDTILILK